ncbi:MAG: phage holin family protein, partial [Bifidobacteriaceae bacterium]|nr:phage holin family protein [Bifidobacteriaceae bacterium]
MVPFGWRVVINAAGLWAVCALWDSMRLVPGDGSFVSSVLRFLVLGLILAAVDSIVKPVAKFISFPLYILTFGLFALVVNAAMLELVSWIASWSRWGLEIDSFATAVGAALALAVLTALLSLPFKRRAARDRR